MEVKLSSKNQIVVPREAREALGAKAGSPLLVVVRNGSITLLPMPRDYAKAIRGSDSRPVSGAPSQDRAGYNDPAFVRIRELDVLVFDDLLERAR